MASEFSEIWVFKSLRKKQRLKHSRSPIKVLMESPHSPLRSLRRIQTAFALAAVFANNKKLLVATQNLTAAEREQPLIALSNNLWAAKLSLSVLEQQPSDST